MYSLKDEFRSTAIVDMELKAGAKDTSSLEVIEGVLGTCSRLPLHNHHFDEAASLYRLCRQKGITVRSMIDCVIAAVALSENAQVLHHDRDFTSIARVVPLRIHPASLGATAGAD